MRAVVTGAAQEVLDDLFSSESDAASLLDVSIDGTLAWVPDLWRIHRASCLGASRRPNRADHVGKAPLPRRYLVADGRTIATAIQATVWMCGPIRWSAGRSRA